MQVKKSFLKILPTAVPILYSSIMNSPTLAQRIPANLNRSSTNNDSNYPLVRDLKPNNNIREREIFRVGNSPVSLPRGNQSSSFTGPSNLRNAQANDNSLFFNGESTEKTGLINYSFQLPLNETKKLAITGGIALDDEPFEITGQIGLRARPFEQDNRNSKVNLEINSSLGIHHSEALGQSINISREGTLRNPSFKIDRSNIPGTTGFAEGEIQLRTNLGNSTLRTGLVGTAYFDERIPSILKATSGLTIPIGDRNKCQSVFLNVSQGLTGNNATLAYIGYRSGCGGNLRLPDFIDNKSNELLNFD